MNMQSLNGDSYQGSQVGANVQSQVGENAPKLGPVQQGMVWASLFKKKHPEKEKANKQRQSNHKFPLNSSYGKRFGPLCRTGAA